MLGIVLWECVTREDPFAGISPFQVVIQVAQHGERPVLPDSCPRE